MNAEVRMAIEEAMRRQREDMERRLPAIVSDAVQATLVRLGIDAEDPIEIQADMLHLRAWRKSSERIKDKAMLAMIGVLVTGTLGALWLGFKELLHR